jgi:hypothetical protein
MDRGKMHATDVFAFSIKTEAFSAQPTTLLKERKYGDDVRTYLCIISRSDIMLTELTANGL